MFIFQPPLKKITLILINPKKITNCEISNPKKSHGIPVEMFSTAPLGCDINTEENTMSDRSARNDSKSPV